MEMSISTSKYLENQKSKRKEEKIMNKTVITLMNEVGRAFGSGYDVRCAEIEQGKN